MPARAKIKNKTVYIDQTQQPEFVNSDIELMNSVAQFTTELAKGWHYNGYKILDDGSIQILVIKRD